MTFSDSLNIMKYRFSHLFKADLELSYKFISLGISSRYNSYMRNIDALFEDGVFGVQILPGLKNYRLENQNGDLVFDGRIIFNLRQKHSISLIVIISLIMNTPRAQLLFNLLAHLQFSLLPISIDSDTFHRSYHLTNLSSARSLHYISIL